MSSVFCEGRSAKLRNNLYKSLSSIFYLSQSVSVFTFNSIPVNNTCLEDQGHHEPAFLLVDRVIFTSRNLLFWEHTRNNTYEIFNESTAKIKQDEALSGHSNIKVTGEKFFSNFYKWVSA